MPPAMGTSGSIYASKRIVQIRANDSFMLIEISFRDDKCRSL
jgi:hypothetical protein